MSSYLLGVIHDRAIDSKPDVVITKDNYKIWVDHWFKTAEALADKFDVEELTVTAKAIRDIIVEERKLLGDKYGS